MSEIILTKRAKSSNSKNSLENFSKLSDFALKGSMSVQKQAKESGIEYMIMRDGKVYKVHPNGYEELISIVLDIEVDAIAFEPLSIAKISIK